MVFIGLSLGHIVGPLLFTSHSGEVLGPLGLWSSVITFSIVIGLVVAISLHIKHLISRSARWYNPQDTKASVVLRSDARLDSALDIEYMQTAAGVYLLDDEDYGLPYIFRSQTYDDLTDLEDEEFLFTL